MHLTAKSLVFLADHFTSGAVFPGHPSQFTSEELLFSGRAAQKSFHRHWRHLFEGLSKFTIHHVTFCENKKHA